VFENRLLRRIFGPNRDWVIGEWRRLRNEELYDLCSLPTIIRVIKSRIDLGRTCSTYRERSAYRILWGDLREGDHLEEPSVDGSIILRWIFKK
jgi:hypothetical protein